MSNYDDFISSLQASIMGLAREILGGNADSAVADAKDFLEKAKNDLQRWTSLLQSGELSNDEFQDLVQSKRDLAQMHALTQIGISAMQMDQFKTGVISLIVSKAVQYFQNQGS